MVNWVVLPDWTHSYTRDNQIQSKLNSDDGDYNDDDDDVPVP